MTMPRTPTEEGLARLGLQRNPFPPATTGAGISDSILPPERWRKDLTQLIDQLARSEGEKALAISGGYGSGKTFLLNWIEADLLSRHRVLPYFFENPGVAFYDLANALMRQVGRYELAKSLWERLHDPSDPEAIRRPLIPLEFGQWLRTMKDRGTRDSAIDSLTHGMRELGFATEEEILNKLSRLVVETGERPYFEYRDFVPRSRSTLVAERQEAPYFRALVRILLDVFDAEGCAFLIDEFEDVALDRRLSRRQATEYIATMRRLLDTAREEDLWVILSTTPEGLARTNALEPSMMERFSGTYEIPGLDEAEAYDQVKQRLVGAGIGDDEGIAPFAEDAITFISETTKSNPRRLIKVMWLSLGLAVDRDVDPPITGELVREAEERIYRDDAQA